MRRKRTSFASPFVVTIACGGAPATVPPPPPPLRPVPVDSALEVAEVVVDAPVAIDAQVVQVGSVRFVDPGCKRREASGEDTNVDCPEDLVPTAPAGELIVEHNGACYRVYERKLGSRTSRYYWDEGRVRCPANVELPPKLVVTIGRDRFRLDEESLTCRREVASNPPYWTQAPCPSVLIPKLVGLTPDAPCSYRGIAVNCGATGNPPGPARIIGIRVVGNGTEIVIARGKSDGLAAGMHVRLKGMPVPGTITSCNERTCTARVTATPDQVKASSGSVEIVP